MVSKLTSVGPEIMKRHAIFIVFVAASCLVFYKTTSELIRYSLHDDSASHVILILVIAFFLVGLERNRIFSITRSSPLPGVGLIGAGLLLFWQASRLSPQ